jgi:hypothetical protein
MNDTFTRLAEHLTGRLTGPLPAAALIALVVCAPASAQTGGSAAPAAAVGPPAMTEAAAGAQSTGQKVVEEGIFPKSIRIPGTDLSLGIGGYVKLDVVQDFSAIGDAFEFRTNTIPATDSAAAAQSGQTTIHARETRINLDLRTDTSDAKFRAFVEGDFYGSGNAFRLRHGFGELGPLLGGQTWTTFMDISARPFTLDFEGPDGEVFVRQAMLRWRSTLGAHWSWAVAVESPTPQFAVPSSLDGAARSNVPDVPAYVRYEQPRGHVQLGLILRQIRFDGGEDVANDSTITAGVNATFSVKTTGSDLLQGQFMIGEGMARYIEALGGQNLDAILTPEARIYGLRTQAGMLAYTHHWREALRSVVAYSTASVDDDPGLPSTAIERTQDVRLNLVWTPFRLVDIGGEILWGRRANQDGSRGDAWRFQFSTIYRLG